jgi:molybdopterin molybdotransferase
VSKPFFTTLTLEQVHALAEGLEPLGSEAAPLGDALGRTLAADAVAPEDLPGFARASMDGYAIRSRDSFGASEAGPAYLELGGEVRMGEAPAVEVVPGRCCRIGTGGMLPRGADGVVMLEHTRLLDERTVEIASSVAPGANVMGPKDDVARGEVLLRAGHRLRPQDVGLLAALGRTSVEVRPRPRLGVLSSGDEVVAVEETPGPGQVRDVNSFTLSSQIREAGGEPVLLGRVPDDEAALRAAVARSVSSCRLTLLSGGSSVGARDLTAQVFGAFPDARLLCHGVAVAPGKPFIWTRLPGHDLLGLPGQVASCLVAFHLFVEPILERLMGRPPASFTRFGRVEAVLSRNVPSSPGRESYIRVGVRTVEGQLVAEPLFGKSGLIRTLVEGRGLLRIPLGSEGIEAGARVTVHLFP